MIDSTLEAKALQATSHYANAATVQRHADEQRLREAEQAVARDEHRKRVAAKKAADARAARDKQRAYVSGVFAALNDLMLDEDGTPLTGHDLDDIVAGLADMFSTFKTRGREFRERVATSGKRPLPLGDCSTPFDGALVAIWTPRDPRFASQQCAVAGKLYTLTPGPNYFDPALTDLGQLEALVAVGEVTLHPSE